MTRPWSLLPRPMRRVGRRVVDGIRARRAWSRMLDEAEAGSDGSLRGRRGEVCLLAWSFPPVVQGGTYRPLALVRHGTDLGLSFTVISCAFHQEPSAAGMHLAERVPSSARVIRTRPSPLRPAGWALPDLDGGALNVLEIWETVSSAFASERPDLLFATGPPFHTFVAGKLLADRYGIPLVLEYRDEWTECPFDFVHDGTGDRLWEARCLESAQLVIFTTRSQLEHQLDVFGGLRREKCVVIPNGWEADGDPYAAGDVPESRSETGRCVISFTGNLGDHTPPGEFLDCLLEATRKSPELAGRFSFRFVGNRSAGCDAQLDGFPLQGMIERTNLVSRAEVHGIQRASDGLLLLNGARLERYIPGKLYEYLATGRPILVYGAGGEVGALVQQLHAGFVVPEGDAAVLTEALLAIEAEPKDVGIPDQRSTWLERHTRRALAVTTVDFLGRLLRQPAEGVAVRRRRNGEQP